MGIVHVRYTLSPRRQATETSPVQYGRTQVLGNYHPRYHRQIRIAQNERNERKAYLIRILLLSALVHAPGKQSEHACQNTYLDITGFGTLRASHPDKYFTMWECPYMAAISIGVMASESTVTIQTHYDDDKRPYVATKQEQTTTTFHSSCHHKNKTPPLPFYYSPLAAMSTLATSRR